MEEEARNERYHVPLFDGTNYSAWRFRMQVLLEEHELYECVEKEIGDLEELKDVAGDTAEKKQEKAKLREKRQKKERKCKSLLICRISDSQLEYVQEQKTPKNVWDALKRVFERRSIASRMHLKRRMLSLRFEGGSLQDHFLRFDKLVREYRGTGAEMEELDVICHLLLTLGPAFSTVVTAIETMPEDNLNMEFVKCRLLDEEIKQKKIGGEFVPPKTEAAFWGSKQQTKNKIIKCFGCEQDGHKLPECPSKKKESDKKTDRKPKALAAAEQHGVCFVGVRGGKETELRSVQWYIDSECSDHMINDAELFEEFKPLQSPVEIAIAKDGESIVARHSGSVKVISNVRGEYIECTVRDVLYVPELRCNLFSVMRVDHAGMKVTYESGKVMIHQGSRIVASGSRVGKLYRLDLYACKAKGVFIGYGHNGYRMWNPGSQRIVHACDVEFEELECSGTGRPEAVVDRRVQGDGSRPQRARNVPAWHSDYEVEYAAYTLNAMSFVEELPPSLEDMRKRSDWNKREVDVMTKGLPAKEFQQHRASIGLV